MSANKKIACIVGILVAWIAILMSPIGYYAAGVCIVGLIIVIFVCGCISVKKSPDK
jgi:hypothetical protein